MKRFFISSIIFLLFLCNVFAQKAVIIESEYDGWTDSGVDVSNGQSVLLLGYGLANTDGSNSQHFHNPHHWGGPAGCAFKAGVADPSWNFLADGLAQMALVGRIGSGDPFFVGNMAKFTASTSGRLYLGYNDQHGSFSANVGQFICFIITTSNLTKISQNSEMINDFELGQNYPNPFNPSTNIDYSLNNTGRTTVKIFNSLGQEAKTLVDEIASPGSYSIHWDGRDNNGYQVPSGQYFYQVSQNKMNITKKALLLK